MITITTHSRDSSRLNDKYFEENGITTTILVFKPRTKAEIVKEKTTELLVNAYHTGIINKHTVPLDSRSDIHTFFDKFHLGTITSRNASALAYDLDEYVLASRLLPFTRSVKFFSIVSGFTALGTTKFKLLTHKFFENSDSLSNVVPTSRNSVNFIIFKCKSMETYEILEKIATNQSILPFGDTSQTLKLLRSIINTHSQIKSQS